MGAQFCVQLAFGVVLALAFVPRAPVGAFFYRLMAASAAMLLAVAVALRISGPGAQPGLVGALGAALLGVLLVAAGPLRPMRWRVALALSLGGCVLALGLLLRATLPGESTPRLLLASGTALATGLVAGSVGLAMVLGHWYLTVPKLEVAHLVRLNRVTIAAMIATAVLLAASCLAFSERLADADVPLSSPFGLFHLATRVVVGLALPMLFAWMTAGSLAYRNTRSATGILYASTVLVLIGAAASVTLQQSYGVPL